MLMRLQPFHRILARLDGSIDVGDSNNSWVYVTSNYAAKLNRKPAMTEDRSSHYRPPADEVPPATVAFFARQSEVGPVVPSTQNCWEYVISGSVSY